MEWLPLLFSGVSSLVSGWMGNNAADEATEQQSRAIRAAMEFQTNNLNKVLGLQGRTTDRILSQNRYAGAAANKSIRNARDSALKSQNAATGKAVGVQQGFYNKAKGNLAPWMKAGVDALEAYSGELGLGGADGTPYKSKFRETPGYQYAVAEAEKGAVNNMRALGMGGSGAALKALTAQRMGMADQTYNQYLDRLKGVADNGQGAATNLAQIGAQTGSNIAQTYMQGAAQNNATYAGAGSSLSQNYMQGAANAANARQTGASNLINTYLNGGNAIADNMLSLGGVQAAGTVGGNNAWMSALGNFGNNASRSLGNWGSNWGGVLGQGAI